MMKKREEMKLSSFMTKILRHAPQEYDIQLDEYGFCEVSTLTMAIKSQGFWSHITEEWVLHIGGNCPKQRYILKGNKIKARYGHSISVIQEQSDKPLPLHLYHGTNKKALESILKAGISPMGRQFVHLSESTNFATLAAKRRNEPLLVKIDTQIAKDQGVSFLFAGNEVWLSTTLPVQSIIEKCEI